MVKAHPNARHNGITGIHNGHLKVSVTQAPEKGKATQAILELLANELELKRTQIKLIAGETSQIKKFLVSDISLGDLQIKLNELLE